MSAVTKCWYCDLECQTHEQYLEHMRWVHDRRATPPPAAAGDGQQTAREYGRQPDYNALVDARAERDQLRADLAAALAALAMAERERDELRAVAKATRDTLTVIDEWLGMASTRQAAIDSMRRLERMLRAVGFEYTWKGILDWRGSLIDELWNARFYSGPDHHWHYVPGDPEPKFGNAEGPELAEIVSVMESALRDRAAMSIALEQETKAHDALANALADILRQHAPQLLVDGSGG